MEAQHPPCLRERDRRLWPSLWLWGRFSFLLREMAGSCGAPWRPGVPPSAPPTPDWPGMPTLPAGLSSPPPTALVTPPSAPHGLGRLLSLTPLSPPAHRQLLKTELGSFFTEYLQVGGPSWPEGPGVTYSWWLHGATRPAEGPQCVRGQGWGNSVQCTHLKCTVWGRSVSSYH